MVIYELLIVIIVFWIFVMLLNKDIFAPSSMLCLSYILATLCAIYNIDKWRINLHYNTFGVIVIGIFCFIITDFFVKMLRKKSYARESNDVNNKLEFLETDSKILIGLNVISLIVFMLYTIFFVKALSKLGSLSNFSAAMQIYRSKTQFGGIEYIPTVVNFLSKFCRAIAYVYVYVIINNIIVNNKENNKIKFKNINKLILGILIYFPLTLMSGGRFDLISYFIYIIVLWSILYKKATQKNIKVKSVIKVVLLVVGIVLIFSNTRSLVGRTSESGTMDYITEYFGGSIYIFDEYMQEVHEFNGVVGQELFAGTRKLLHQLHIIDDFEKSSDLGEFRTIYDGTVIGNVYTGFRKMNHDFGFIGIIVFQCIMSIIFNSLYYSIIEKQTSSRKISMRIVIFSCISFCLAFHSYSETFFSNVISFNYMALFFMMYFVRFCILKVKIKQTR